MSNLHKTRPKIALIPSLGIGDAIIFLKAAKGFSEKGYDVCFFHDAIKSLSPSLPLYSFFPKKIEKEDLLNFDIVFAQYDDTEETKKLLSLKEVHPKFHLFYPTHNKTKHESLTIKDFASNPNKTMVKNLTEGLKKVFQIETLDTNYLSTANLTFRKEKKRVCIHPLSSERKRVWPLKKYLLLAKKLKKLGFDPVFVMNEDEYKTFPKSEKACTFPSLSKLADFIYESGYFIGNESGPAHLASLLKTPSLIIACDYKRLKLWKPDFSPVKLLTPSPLIPNLKGFRLREKHWSFFITVTRVLNEFIAL